MGYSVQRETTTTFWIYFQDIVATIGVECGFIVKGGRYHPSSIVGKTMVDLWQNLRDRVSARWFKFLKISWALCYIIIRNVPEDKVSRSAWT